MRCVGNALGFDPPQHAEQIRRFDRGDGSTSEIGDHPFVELIVVPLPRARRQGSFLDHQPFVRDGDEGVGGGAALGLAPGARVDAIGDEFARVVALLSCSLQWDVGVRPESQQLLYATQAITEAPETATGGRDEEEKPPLVEELVGLRSRLSGSDPRFTEGGHPGVAFRSLARCPCYVPLPGLGCQWNTGGAGRR